MPNGIIIMDKPSDWTSMDVCAKLRGIFREKRIGHAGTLDPMATGILPVFVGRATRAVEFTEDYDKEYIAGLKLGVVTNTQDTTGEVLEEHPVHVTREDVERILERFRGPIEQIPPMYSAIKIGGKKLYELARKGKEVERKARRIVIEELEILEQVSQSEYLIRVSCSKGTYVRTLCHDIGQALGCGAVMFSLRRTMACGFSLKNSYSLDAIQAAEDPSAFLLPVDSFFSSYPALTLSHSDEKKVRNGVALRKQNLPNGIYRLYGAENAFLSVSHCENGNLKSMKNFFGA